MKAIVFSILLHAGILAHAQSNTQKQVPGGPEGQTSFIISIPVKHPLTAPLPAQATQRLLWYKGKKLNDSILVTPGNTLVLYSKKRDMVVVQPEKKKDASVKSIVELSRTPEKKEAFVKEMSKYKVYSMWYPHIIKTKEKLDEINESYGKALANTISLPASVNATAYIGRNGSYSFNNLLYVPGIVPAEIKRLHAELMARVKNYPSINFDAPPSQEMSACVSCNEKKKEEYGNEVKEWSTEFSKYETDIIQRSLVISRSLTDIAANDAEAQKISADIEKAIGFAFKRLSNKIDLLIRDHGQDASKLGVIVRTVISIERQKQLIGLGEDTYSETMTKLLSLFDVFDRYIQKQIEEKNYDFVLNIPFLISLERQRQLLGGNDDKMPDILERVNDFNRFKLEMSMSFKGEYYGCNTPSTESMQAKTTEDYYVSLALVNCKYLLVPAEQHLKNIPNYHFGYGYNLVLKISNGIGTYRFSDDEDKCHSKPYNYTGLEVRPYSPIARFTFCDDEQDSLTFHDLHLPVSREETKGAKVFHVIDNIVHYSNQSDGSFPEHLIRATEELEALKQKLEEYRMRNNAGTLNEEQMKEMHELAIKREELVRILYEFQDSKKMLQIMFDARNRAAAIIDETVDIDYHFEHDDQKGEVKFNIKVVHDPVKGK